MGSFELKGEAYVSVSMVSTKASTTSGSNCVPEDPLILVITVWWRRCLSDGYPLGLGVPNTPTSYASATANMRAPSGIASPFRPSRKNLCLSVVEMQYSCRLSNPQSEIRNPLRLPQVYISGPLRYRTSRSESRHSPSFGCPSP